MGQISPLVTHIDTLIELSPESDSGKHPRQIPKWERNLKIRILMVCRMPLNLLYFPETYRPLHAVKRHYRGARLQRRKIMDVQKKADGNFELTGTKEEFQSISKALSVLTTLFDYFEVNSGEPITIKVESDDDLFLAMELYWKDPKFEDFSFPETSGMSLRVPAGDTVVIDLLREKGVNIVEPECSHD